MAANTSPVFPLTPIIGMVQVSTANTARDGTGTIASVTSAAPTEGTRIDAVRVVGTGATTAGVIRLFLYDGTNTRLWKEIMVAAITPSTSVEVWYADYVPTVPLVLPSTWILKASTHNAETFNVFAHGGTLTA